MTCFRSFFVFFTLFSALGIASEVFAEQRNVRPNVVILLADDLGIGDTSCYGATVFQTPQIDSLAKNGIRFTQGYATSATCTPSRYALMTGNYPIRNKNANILPGNAPIIIEPQSLTLPRMFQNAGYRTFAVGKWHLGLADSLDMLDALTGRSEKGRDDLLLEANRQLSYRTGKWYLVPHEKNTVELFDLENDPSQKKDVAAEHPEVVRRLTEQMNSISR